MALSKVVAAKVSAYHSGWVHPEEFAEFAEKGLIYQQWHHGALKEQWSFFAIGKGDKDFPKDKLTDRNYARNLSLVLPCDALSSKIISVLSSIEAARQSGDSESMFDIDIVLEEVKDSVTGESKYGCVGFPSTADMVDKILNGFERKQQKQGKQIKPLDLSSLTDSEIRKAFKRTFKNLGSVSLNQVDEYTPRAKRYKFQGKENSK